MSVPWCPSQAMSSKKSLAKTKAAGAGIHKVLVERLDAYQMFKFMF